MQDTDFLTPKLTADGSFTFFSEAVGESFHSIHGAKTEALCKFVEPCQLAQLAQKPVLRLLDVCYGLGYNTAAALEVIWTTNPHCRVELVALELDAGVPRGAIAHNLLNNYQQPIPQLLQLLATTFQVKTTQFNAQLYLDDARITIQKLSQSNLSFDAIFLDPFSPPHCPQLWTIEFMQQLAICCAPQGRIATYSCAASVRSGLIAAGFKIGRSKLGGGRLPGTVGSFNEVGLISLSKRSQEHLQTRAAVPYRDPQLNDSKDQILQRRQLEQQISSLEPSSRWHKRWSKINK
jgi:tRNA U34 5-methylaminomethyl-2-thiouridine-forming methyltransferase MnmC